MTWVRVICLMLGVLAVTALGPLSSAPARAEAPPCHATGGGHSAPSHHPDKPTKAMGCCVACTAAAVPERLPGDANLPTLSALSPALDSLLTGRTPGPEPGPPRA